MNLTAKELSGQHIAERITCHFEGQPITGTLAHVSHEADFIEEVPLCAPRKQSLGKRWVNVTIWGTNGDDEVASISLKPESTVTIQEEQ